MNRALLKNRDFLHLISAQTVSNLGDWLDILALLTLIGIKWNASPMAVSGVMLCIAVPNIIVGTYGGVLADRLNRKTLMILTDLFRAVTVLGILSASQLWHIYILLCIKSIFSAIFIPAKEGKLREIVDDDHIQPAVAISGMINNTAKIIGPSISGILVASMGVKAAFYLDAGSFMISVLLLLGLRNHTNLAQVNHPQDNVPSHTTKATWWQQLTAGFKYMKQSPVLISGLFILALVMAFLQIADSQAIVLFRNLPDLPLDVLGYSMAASGAGLLIISFLLTKFEINTDLKLITIGAIGLGLALLATGTLVYLPIEWVAFIAPISFFIAGASYGITLIPYDVLLQKSTPSHYTGRVFGTMNSVTTFAVVLGMTLGGLLTAQLGVVTAFVLSGGLLCAVGIVTGGLRKRLEGRDIFVTESFERTHRETENANS